MFHRLIRFGLIFANSTLSAQEIQNSASSGPLSEAQAAKPSTERTVLIVKTGDGMGTAFRYRDKDGVFLVSNLHVVAATAPLEIYDTDGHRADLGKYAEVAQGTDLVRFPQKEGIQLEPALSPRLGESVISLGNSGGGNVITENPGKVLGVGPQTFEVSCEIVQGNSGGPIVNSEGKVIGVASFLTRQQNAWQEDTRYNEVRRFGIRLDQPLVWEKVTLAEIQTEGSTLQAILKALLLISETMKKMTGSGPILKEDLPLGLPFPQKAQRNFDQAMNYYNKNLITARNRPAVKLGFKQVFTHLNETVESLVEDQKPAFQSSWGLRQYNNLSTQCREFRQKLIERRDEVLKTL